MKFLEDLRGRLCILFPLIAEWHIRPAREAVFQVPLGLPVTEEDEGTHDSHSEGRNTKSVKDLP